jgi:hypothetical protein
MIKKKWCKLNTSTNQPHRIPKNERQNRKQSTKKQKQESSMKNSASLTPIQVPSTVACMIVTILS